MFDKLEDILFRYDEVLKELSEPEVLNDASRYLCFALSSRWEMLSPTQLSFK